VGAVFQHAVEDGLGEVAVVEDVAPFAQRFVGGEDHGLLAVEAAVDDAVEDVGGIVGVLEVADLVDDQIKGYRWAA